MTRSERLERRLSASPSSVWAVLSDVGAWAEWVPAVSSSRVLAREGDVLVAGLVVPALDQPRTTLELVLTPSSELVFTETDRLRRRGLSGRVGLRPADGASAVVAELSYRGGLRPGCRGRLRDAIEGVLDALEERAAISGVRRRLLRVVRGPEGLKVVEGGPDLAEPA